MEEPLEQEHSISNDDLKPSSSSSTTTKASRLTKQTTTNGTTRRHKRRRQTNSTRSSSDHSSSSSRSSSSSSHSSHSSSKNLNSNDQESKKTRSCLAQEQLQIIVDKTKTGKYDILDSFAFLSFETDEDWRIAFEHFKQQQQLQEAYTRKKSFSLVGKKNGNGTDHLDEHTLHRSISVPCKIEDGHRHSSHPISAPADDTTSENHRSSMWQNLSPNKMSNDRQSMSTIKSEPIDKTNRSSRTTSENEDNHCDNGQHQNSTTSSQKSADEIKIESHEKKHHHHHHHHKSHKRHKTKHDLSVNGDSGNKHPTITSMSDLAKQQIKNEPIPLPTSFNFPPHFDPKLFPLPSFTPFPHHHPPPPQSSPFPGSYDHSLMLASRFYGGQYPRDLPMPPPPRPPSRSLQHPFSLKENHSDSSTSMEKMLEKYYPGVLPSYLAAAASAAAAASTNSNSPVSSLNVKMHGASPHMPDHPLWSHRESLQRQLLAASNKPNSTKSSSNHAGPSPNDNHHHHHHHHRRHNSSTSNSDIPNSTTPTGHPLYIAPVIVTEFHQHQHNHNHTHEHKLNITTKDDRQSSPRSKTPLSNEPKKPKTGFSVTDMFTDKSSPVIKHSPQSSLQQSQSQGFLSVINNKKDNNQSSLVQLKKPSNGKWSTAHVHIAWMIFNNEQRKQDKLNLLNPTNKIRPSSSLMSSSSPSNQSTFLPPPLPLNDSNNDLSLIRPPLPPSAPSSFSFPFDIHAQQNHLFRSLSSSKLPRPTVTSSSSSSSSSIKMPTIKREQKTPLIDERVRRTSPSPSSRSTLGSTFLPPSPSHRARMDFLPSSSSSSSSSSLLLPPSQHSLPSFSLNDDRKRFLNPNPDFLPPFGPPSSTSSPFFPSLFPMGAPPIPPPPPPPMHSSSSRRSGMNSDSSKSSLFPPSFTTSFDFTRSPLLPPGFSLLPTNNHLESDRYRFILEQQARERDLQFAMMAAATGGAPPSLFTDPNSTALFKHC
ncbi:hypothetical protein I4U23_007546 [Adineta vaga]|nr:hypothetical protein I4U23_007546 [Adineta vaga]